MSSSSSSAFTILPGPPSSSPSSTFPFLRFPPPAAFLTFGPSSSSSPPSTGVSAFFAFPLPFPSPAAGFDDPSSEPVLASFFSLEMRWVSALAVQSASR